MCCTDQGSVATLAERERPPAEIKDALNERLKELGTVRISGRLAVPPRVMGKAAFVHLSDGISRMQIYVRKQDAVAISNDTGNPLETEDSGWELFELLDHGDFRRCRRISFHHEHRRAFGAR
jgi:lysyl-tRNA synthetase class II